MHLSKTTELLLAVLEMVGSGALRFLLNVSSNVNHAILITGNYSLLPALQLVRKLIKAPNGFIIALEVLCPGLNLISVDIL